MSATTEASETDVEDVVAETAPSNWRHMINPDAWAEQVHDTSDGYFSHRVGMMDSETHLLAAVGREADRDDVRSERVGELNQRLTEVRNR